LNENEELSKILKILKNYGADFSLKDKREKNALLYLTSSKLLYNDNLESLCPTALDINIEDFKGRTPLLLLIKNSPVSLVSLLHNKGADINIANKYGATPFLFSLMIQCSYFIFYILFFMFCLFYFNFIFIYYCVEQNEIQHYFFSKLKQSCLV
jgi:ankyrin repeat protein